MRILNLYAGIGGNRKLWGNEHEITAVEYVPEIAEIYKEFFPNDTVIVTDAHEYLLKHYKEFDFIWSSPPCPTHSDIRRCGVHRGQYEAKYPDMTLYQEIILLNNFGRAKFVVENVIPYYKPLIPPTAEIGRHYFWSNFYIPEIKTKEKGTHENMSGSKTQFGFNIKEKNLPGIRKAQVLRNLVNPETGKLLFELAFNFEFEPLKLAL